MSIVGIIKKIRFTGIILIVILICLFLLPNLWLDSGQYLLGGDDSRVYLYEPLKWLENIGFWPKVTTTIFSSGIPQHMYIPFLLFSVVIQKLFFFANLQAILYGMSLSLGFLGVYLLIRELIDEDNTNSFISGVIGGLTYIFLPLSYIVFFVNPVKYIFIIFLFPLILFFYIKSIKTKDIKPLFFGAIITALFSISFSEIPFLYAFLIASTVFVIVYFIFINKKLRLILKYGIIYGLFIFLFNLFWIIPFFSSPFFGENVVSRAVSKQVRSENIPSIRKSFVNHNLGDALLGLRSRTQEENNNTYVALISPVYNFSFVNIIFPIIIISGLLYLKPRSRIKKIYLACLAPFILLAYLQSVNIGSWGPQVFENLVRFVPGFVGLRNFDFKVAPTFLLFYSLVFSISLYMMLNFFRKYKVIQGIIVSSVLIIILFNAFPFVSGNATSVFTVKGAGDVERKVRIPEEYIHFLNNIVPNFSESRIVTLPLTFGTWSILADNEKGVYIGHPLTQVIGGKDSIGGRLSFLDKNLKTLDSVVEEALLYENYEVLQSLLGFINVQNIVYHPSVFSSEAAQSLLSSQLWSYNNGLNQEKYLKFLDSLQKDEDNSQSDIYETYQIPQEYFRPRIYSSNKVIETESVQSILSNIDFILGQDNKSVISERNKIANSPNNESALKQFVNSKIVYGECIECFSSDESILRLPHVRILPTSIIYPYIQWKDKKALKDARTSGDNNYLLTIQLEKSSKRLKELETLVVIEKTESKILIEALKRYEAQLNEALITVESAEEGSINKNQMMSTLDDYLKLHIDHINSQLSKPFVSKTNKFGTLYQEKLDNLENEKNLINKKIWTSEEDVARYFISAPDNGKYNLYIRNLDELVFDKNNINLIINNESFDSDINFLEDGTLYLGEYLIKEGENKVSVDLLNDENLIIDVNDNLILSSKSAQLIDIPDHQWNKNYQIIFDYELSEFSRGLLKINQDNDKVDEHGVIQNKVVKTLSPTESIKNMSFIFSPSVNSKNSNIEFSLNDSNKDSFLEVTNLKIIEVESPELLLVKDLNKNGLVQPEVTFTSINPIMYSVNIRNAKDPFLLVLSDSFHKGWRVYKQDKQQTKNYKKDFQERKLISKFIPSENFTLGEQIAKDSHISINGYANAWIITPEDLDGESEQNLIIYFWPQFIFYVSAVITLVSILLISIYLWIFYKKSR